MSNPRLSAHRGGPDGRFAPNSLDAIEASLDLGVDLVEFDVRITSDGKFVTCHDDSIVIDGKRRLIQDLTESYILSNTRDAVRVPEILETIKGRAMGHVDLKDTWLEVEVADLCESVLGRDGFILTTLEDVSVLRIRDARPHLAVALSLGRNTDGLGMRKQLGIRLSEIFPARRVKACRPTMLAVRYTLARLGVLRWATRHRMNVLAWTVNEPRQIARIVHDRRYWAFATDYPALALKLRADGGK